jgi:hypothetical protein
MSKLESFLSGTVTGLLLAIAVVVVALKVL